MDYVRAKSLSRAPRRKFAGVVKEPSEQPNQSVAQEHAQKRLVNPKPLIYKSVPSVSTAQIVADAERRADNQCSESCAVGHFVVTVRMSGNYAQRKHHYILQIMRRCAGSILMKPKSQIQLSCGLACLMKYEPTPITAAIAAIKSRVGVLFIVNCLTISLIIA